MATFDEAIVQLPYNPVTESGRGFLPPFSRAVGHILYLLGRLSDTPTRRPTDNQIRQEIDSIKVHFGGFFVPDYLSEQAKTHVMNWRIAFDALDTEIAGWDGDTRIANLQKLQNRTIQLFAFLDREVLGLRDSDPGQEL